MFCPLRKKAIQVPVTERIKSRGYDRLPCSLCGYSHTEFHHETFREIEEHGIKASINTWAIPFPYYYIDYSQHHSVELMKYFDELVRPLSSYPHLAITPEEMLIISISAYLHDIGMQSIGEEMKHEFEEVWKEQGEAFLIRYEDLLNSARKIHGERIEDDIKRTFARFKRSPVISSKGKKLIDSISEPVQLLCSYHTGSPRILESLGSIHENYPAGNSIITRDRLLMLIGLFRLADKLDITRDRIAESTLKFLPVPRETMLPLHRYEIVRSVHIDAYQRIRIDYDDSSRFTTNVMKTVYEHLFRELNALESLEILKNGSGGFLNFRREKRITETSSKLEWPREIRLEHYDILEDQLIREQSRYSRGEQLYFNYQFELDPPEISPLTPLPSTEEELDKREREKKVTVDLINTDIHEVLRLLERESGVKLVMQPGVTRMVTFSAFEMPATEILERIIRENLLSRFIVDDLVYVGEKLWTDRIRRRFRAFLESETDKKTISSLFTLLPVQETTIFFKSMFITQSVTHSFLDKLTGIEAELRLLSSNLLGTDIKESLEDFIRVLRNLLQHLRSFTSNYFDRMECYHFGQPRVTGENYFTDLDMMNSLIVKTQYCFERCIHNAYDCYPELFYIS